MVKTRSQAQRELFEVDHQSSESVPHDAAPQEMLGRGCRVRRPLLSLDEEYIRESYGTYSRQSGRRGRDDENDPSTFTFGRYSQRDAAKRALSKIHETMEVEEGSNSNSQVFNFRHHPELNTSNSTGGSNSSPAASPSSSSEDSEDPKGGNGSSQVASRMSGGQRGYQGSKRSRSWERDDAVSFSDESLRNESESSESNSDSEDSISDVDEKVENPKKYFEKANHNAKESINKNVDINYYLNDAIGKEDAHTIKKKQIDRRYRHLFVAEKKEKRAADEGEKKGVLGDVSPLSVDPSVSFDSVGGLPEHIVTLREMVIFPLLYPDLLSKFNLRPPRGVLFVGPPGNGKTLMARALANEGSQSISPKITFFMRKGADILSKWVGESERQLSLLFEEAKAKKPSIIFFDEIDGLAPVRHCKTEQSHASLVATFLALMDGLEDRGQVVVIGATNRPDTIDPALRRPGRFDRELFFPYPNRAARKHVLSIVTSEMKLRGSETPPGNHYQDSLVNDLVCMTEGFSGADLKALCLEAGLNRLRTALPQLYTTSKKLSLPALDSLTIRREDFFVAAHRIRPSINRSSESHFASTILEEHWDYLLQDSKAYVVSELSHQCSIQKVLREESIDSTDVGAAVGKMSCFPVPYEKNPFMLLLEHSSEASNEADDGSRIALNTALAVIKRFPSIPSIIVHMFHLQVDFDYTPTNLNSVGETFSSGHIFELVSFLLRTNPCFLILQGFEEWLAIRDTSNSIEDEGGEGSQSYALLCSAWRYYMNLLANTEVLILVPCRDSTRIKCFLEDTVTQKTDIVPFNISYKAIEVPVQPTRCNIVSFIKYMYRIFLATCHQRDDSYASLELVQDHSSNDSKSVEKAPQNELEYEEAIKLWRKVEYRRLQLRHVLSKWVTQYITTGKYKILHSEDLDFGHDDPLLNAWRAHTAGRRIGLCDILHKVECHQYVCLSDYHDDIDTLVHNVRSFFRSRSPFDTKYRLKALDLKENTILGLYKVNKHLVRYCEEHKELTEPPLCSEGTEKDHKTPTQYVQKRSFQHRKPHSYFGSRRKKRRNLRKMSSAESNENARPKDDAHQEVCAESNDEMGAVEKREDVITSPASLCDSEKELLSEIADLCVSCSVAKLHHIYVQVMKYLGELPTEKKLLVSGQGSSELDILRVLERGVVLALNESKHERF